MRTNSCAKWAVLAGILVLLGLGALVMQDRETEVVRSTYVRTDSEASVGRDCNNLYLLIRKLLADNDTHISSQLSSELRKYVQEMPGTSDEYLPRDLTPQRDSTTKTCSGPVKKPSLAYEKVRRKITNGVRELWYYVRGQLTNIKKMTDNGEIHKKIDIIIEDGADQQRSVLVDLHNLTRVDGYQDWREKEAKALGELAQKRIRYLQNPKNCDDAKILHCDFHIHCGYACQAHHVSYCMMVAYGMGRRTILDPTALKYGRKSWDQSLLRLSDKCNDKINGPMERWGAKKNLSGIHNVHMPTVDETRPELPDELLGIPEDISERLMTLHGRPIVWWIGQLMLYAQRLQPSLAEELKRKKKEMGFENPIAGIHIRRTDKLIREMEFHAVEEYMYHVEEYFKLLERMQPVPVKRVYLATDEAKVVEEAKKKYPDYVFLNDKTIAKSAGLNSRFSSTALSGVLIDIYLLSFTDFIVCTFSSGICRDAYELMQTYHTDHSANYRNLDMKFYYQGQYELPDHNMPHMRAIYEHKPRESGEVEFVPGDMLSVDRNLLNGYSKGNNHRIKPRHQGVFPSYKVEDIVRIVKAPTYREVDEM